MLWLLDLTRTSVVNSSLFLYHTFYFTDIYLFSLFTGVPERFDIMLKLCMAGYGITNLNEIILSTFKNKIRSKSTTTMRWGTATIKIVFTGILAVLICFEYSAIPYVTTKIEVSSFYRQMATNPKNYGVIDIPSQPVTLYMATIHQKSLVEIMCPGLL